MAAAPFDITAAVRRVAQDMVTRLPELGHVDMARVAVGFCRARASGPYGIHASLTPLRFEGGATAKRIRGRWYGCQRLVGDAGQECLYLLNVYLPRFLSPPLEEKLTTIAHELWHVGPAFDGDLRRHGGRCYAHGPSGAAFDAHAAALAKRWLEAGPPGGLFAFLEGDMGALVRAHGRVVGRRYPAPKLTPLAGPPAGVDGSGRGR